jgi:hypothetical protein
MKKLLPLFYLLIAVNAFCQKTVEIDYTNLGVDFFACNVLANQLSVGGYIHQTNLGSPGQRVIAPCHSFKCITLGNSGSFTSDITGLTTIQITGYSIQFPFRQNLRYKISCFGRTEDDQGRQANVGLAFSSTNGGSFNGCATPNSPLSILDPYIYQSELGYADCDGDFKWVTPASAVLNQPYNYLLVAGIRNNLYPGVTWACIQKIKIEEIPIILPANLELTCGSNSPITFTIPNTGNAVSISNYKWNLGASSNGWLYNGAPAPQYINTSTNTITLTPTCGIQQNINAVVTAAGIDYTADPAQVTMKSPVLGINGSNGVINYESYSIPNLPCGSSVTWSVSPSNIFSLGCSNCNSTSLAKISNGTATLIAVVNSCGMSQTLTKQISSCGPYTEATNLSATPGPSYGYYIHFDPVVYNGNVFSNYYLDYFDLTTNSNGGTTNIYYTTANTSQNFFYYIPTGHSFKFRIAPASICGNGPGIYSDWSSVIYPAPSCESGPLSSTLTKTNPCGGNSACTSVNLGWPSIGSASQYKIDYKIVRIATGTVSASGTVTSSSSNINIPYSTLIGTGWTISYRVAAGCNGTFGNFSLWSDNFFLQ